MKTWGKIESGILKSCCVCGGGWKAARPTIKPTVKGGHSKGAKRSGGKGSKQLCIDMHSNVGFLIGYQSFMVISCQQAVILTSCDYKVIAPGVHKGQALSFYLRGRVQCVHEGGETQRQQAQRRQGRQGLRKSLRFGDAVRVCRRLFGTSIDCHVVSTATAMALE